MAAHSRTNPQPPCSTQRFQQRRRSQLGHLRLRAYPALHFEIAAHAQVELRSLSCSLLCGNWRPTGLLSF